MIPSFTRSCICIIPLYNPFSSVINWLISAVFISPPNGKGASVSSAVWFAGFSSAMAEKKDFSLERACSFICSSVNLRTPFPVVLSSPFVLLGFPLPVILLYGICRIKSIAFKKIIAKNSKSGGNFPPPSFCVSGCKNGPSAGDGPQKILQLLSLPFLPPPLRARSQPVSAATRSERPSRTSSRMRSK